MYLQHFKFNEVPFALTPNTHFFLNIDSHLEALNLLLVGLDNGAGFIKIIGQVGTGKTILCRKLLNTLDEKYVTAYLPNPHLTPAGMRIALAEELGIKVPRNQGQHQVLKKISHALIAVAAQGKLVVLLIDEAQAMPEETIEALRLLTNLETETQKLLQVVLFGQPELDELLDRPSLRQLRQRIMFSYHLRALDSSATRRYVTHRLSASGYNGPELFSEKALSRVHNASRGIPRLVNVLCHKALLVAYGRGDRLIDKQHIERAIEDTEDIKPAKTGGQRQWRLLALLLFFGVVYVFLGFDGLIP